LCDAQGRLNSQKYERIQHINEIFISIITIE
jgi:hypothetical protein